MDIPFTISALLKAGLTQTQIGDAVGLKQSSISEMKAGKAGLKRPSYDVVNGLQRLAELHEVPTRPSSTEEAKETAEAAEPSS
jgi:hypothetical protein